jgi:hypothetical protein
MAEEVKEKKKKELPIMEVTTCKSTQQMLRKAAEDGVETAFHRAARTLPVVRTAPWDLAVYRARILMQRRAYAVRA